MFFWLVIILAFILIFLIYAFMQPDVSTTLRSIQINSTPEQIHPYINDLKKMNSWSPFDTDPNVKRTYLGPMAGKGAKFEWTGNSQVGSGSLEITQSHPNKILMNLIMHKPFACDNDVEFFLAPEAGKTRVSWGMSGRANYMMKIFGLLIGKRMVAKQFDKGLMTLKQMVEED